MSTTSSDQNLGAATVNPSKPSSDISRSAAVQSYLDPHPALSHLADLISNAARVEFGPEASLTLQVYRDPEIDDEQLVLFVRLAQYNADTMNRIRAIAEPFDAELCAASGSLLATTDFRSI